MTPPFAWLICSILASMCVVVAGHLRRQFRDLTRGLVVGSLCTPIFFAWGEHFEILPLPLWLIIAATEATGDKRFSAGPGTFAAFLGFTSVAATVFSVWTWARRTRDDVPSDESPNHAAPPSTSRMKSHL